MLHSNEVQLVKRLGLAAKDLRQDKDSRGDYYLVAKIDIDRLSITLFSNSYDKPLLIEEE